MGFSSRAGLGEKWVGRKQRGFSQGICSALWKSWFSTCSSANDLLRCTGGTEQGAARSPAAPLPATGLDELQPLQGRNHPLPCAEQQAPSLLAALLQASRGFCRPLSPGRAAAPGALQQALQTGFKQDLILQGGNGDRKQIAELTKALQSLLGRKGREFWAAGLSQRCFGIMIFL